MPTPFLIGESNPSKVILIHSLLFCEVFSLQPIGIKSGPETRFHRLYYPIIILDKDWLWTEYWGCWRDLIAMHHFGRTDGLFAGNKSFEIVQLLCGQCFGDCYKQQTYVTAIAIFQDYLSSNILNRKGSVISFSVQIIAIFL